jgi:hypothetical protein
MALSNVTLGELAKLIRSKNAGPFVLTIDVMFEDEETYRRVLNKAELRETLPHVRRGRFSLRVRRCLRHQDLDPPPVHPRRSGRRRHVRRPAAWPPGQPVGTELRQRKGFVSTRAGKHEWHQAASDARPCGYRMLITVTAAQRTCRRR